MAITSIELLAQYRMEMDSKVIDLENAPVNDRELHNATTSI